MLSCKAPISIIGDFMVEKIWLALGFEPTAFTTVFLFAVDVPVLTVVGLLILLRATTATFISLLCL